MARRLPYPIYNHGVRVVKVREHRFDVRTPGGTLAWFRARRDAEAFALDVRFGCAFLPVYSPVPFRGRWVAHRSAA